MRCSLLPLACVIVGAGTLHAQSSAIPWSVLANGAGRQSGAALAVSAVVGEAHIGKTGGSGNVVWVGFLPGVVHLGGGTLDVPEQESVLPAAFALDQNYPNPFNPSTTIRYELPAESHVVIRVFDLLGRTVATLYDGDAAAGRYTTVWNATNERGVAVGSGVYFCRIEASPTDGASSFTMMKKMMLMR